MHPLVLVLVTLLVVFAGLQFVGQFIGLFIASAFYPAPFMDMVRHMQSPAGHPELQIPLLIVMGTGHIIGLILFPLFVLKRKNLIAAEMKRRPVYLAAIGMLVLILFSFLVVDARIVIWNEALEFPESMSSFEQWARKFEDSLKGVTEFVTRFDSTESFLVGFLVIAVLPAIGEEFVFRGIVQNDLYRGTGNIHVAIWVSAALFSAFHIQFFGFFPRMLLGALFGYLYYWSGSLWMAMIAHFVNNAYLVVGLYLYHMKYVEVNMEDPEAPPWSAVFISCAVCIGMCYLYKKFFDQRPLHVGADQQNLPHSLD
jgi:membrane protease YdiL (CAAX protease family)